VFDRFWRGDAHCGEGHTIHCGLGLPLCKAVVEQLGGSIEATANAAGMFTVTIRLPRVEVD
jgi:signal transduction histidine kinase